MTLFERIRDLISANINSMLNSAEDPEKMADEYLRQLTNEVYSARTSVAAATADLIRLEQRKTQYQEEVTQWQRKAETALRANDEALARAALTRKVQSQKLAEQYAQQFTEQDEQVDKMQEVMVSLETRIAEVRAKKELIIAKKNRAQTQEAIQQTVRGIGTISSIDKLDQLEERVDDRLNRATAMSKLESNSLDNRLAQLDTQTDVDAELAELKRQIDPK